MFDCVIRGGRVATASDVFEADIGIAGEQIVALGRNLPKAAAEIDARGKLILPGGIDAHAHIEQLSAAGIYNSDTFETATASAAHGGTTTVICFAAQHVGMDLTTVVEEYAAQARKGAIVDYSFHMILADPTDATLAQVPALVAQGHATLKVFMTYDRLKVDDERLLDVLLTARRSKAFVCVHAENHGMISWMGKKLVAAGYKAPKYHAPSHPRGAEAEAITRLITFSEFIDQPVMIFHVSTAEGVGVIRAARARGVKVFAETCSQYLLLTAKDIDRPGNEGAKWICSPPLRSEADQEALWRGLELGDLQLVSSDHAPYAFDETGKLRAGGSPSFKEIANGMPGLEWRMPLLFDAMVSKGRLPLTKFVELTATAPAKIYDFYPRKGSIVVGGDADLVVWDTGRQVTISDAMVHDRAGYTPYAGRTLTGWPETVLRRGKVIVRSGKLDAPPGSGTFLPRTGGSAAEPLGRLAPDMDPARNFGAKLLE